VSSYFERAYVKHSGLAKVEADCRRYSAEVSESWRCELRPTAEDDYCFVAIARRDGGRVNARISHCEREVMAAVNRVYAKRTRLGNGAAKCVEDEDDKWTRDMGSRAGHDRCVVTLAIPDRRRVSARISYCEREAAAAVNRVVARVYEKRTVFENVTADCMLREPERWTCDMKFSGSRDRCDVHVTRRDAGPKVDFGFITCAAAP
jgi:hypothetical protein